MLEARGRMVDLDLDGMMARYGAIVALSPEASLSLGSMEGVTTAQTVARRSVPLWTGLALTGLATAAAYTLHFLPMAPFTLADGSHPAGSAMLAIVIGVLMGNFLSLPANTSAGCRQIVKKLIPVAIVCIGAGLNFIDIGQASTRSLCLMLICMAVAYAAAYWIGRRFGLSQKTSILLGMGTSICGSSAIVATAPLVGAEDDEMVLSIGAINVLGLAAMLALPIAGAALRMPADQFGVWCGTTIHAVPQVLAAGDAHFADRLEAVNWATLIKLARVVMLAPMVMILALIYVRSRTDSPTNESPQIKYAQLTPWFIWGFLFMALLNTMGWLPTLVFDGQAVDAGVSVGGLFKQTGKILLTVCMAAIGLEVRLHKMIGVGAKALGAGLIATLILATTSYLLIQLMI